MQSQKLDALIAAQWPSTLVASTPELAAKGIGDRALTAGVRSGKLLRLRRGAYVRTVDWRHRKPWERELLRIQAHACSIPGRATYSHLSAARLHGCPDWEGGPQVHVTTPFSPAQASSGVDVVAHGGPLNPEEITEIPSSWGRHARVTSLERTVIDCARTLEFETAVVIADQALRRGADPGLMQEYLDSGRITRGARRLRRVLGAMDKRSESVGESRTRLILEKLGIQVPVLQLEVETGIGTFRGDFGWPEQKVILEFDGRAKYFDYAPTEEVIFEERRREKALIAMGWEVVRIEWAHLHRPWELDQKLRVALGRRRKAEAR
ncbi:type IV toxin-antitoxin system AbiEi family antitoxin domain-containing protein [Paenarthrobacter nitroguajacolicus]|uniref:type IV toxin-antitoxin system AbiEi family antitoxin domain-containing protein n=1 Tax=Paenarthrobacter nitroguajacolicus TaxID=211146 RepID=UPI003AEAE610